MRVICCLLVIIFGGCENNDRQNANTATADTSKVHAESTQTVKDENQDVPKPVAKLYSNERFKEVLVEKIGNDSFLIQGKGQIFEASFSWVVEDGHEELKKGFQTTDAGAPEWGRFNFTIRAAKKRANSTLILILFESSPKDGSRQHELPLVLY